MFKSLYIKYFLITLFFGIYVPINAYAFIPKNNIITTAEIANMTNIEIWNNMQNPVVMISNSKVPQATNQFGGKKTKFPLITHQDILNYLLSLPPMVGYTQATSLTALISPANTQISSQITQVITEMNNTFVFDQAATKALATADTKALFPLISSSATNAASGMFNAANESALPTLLYSHSVAFRSIVNKIQIQGISNLSGATNAQNAIGVSIYASRFAAGRGATAGQNGLLGSGQAGKNSLSIADAQEQQIKQMLNATTLDAPTVCSCINTYCTCLAGRVGMLTGYISQTKIQRRQKIDLDKYFSDLTKTIVDAIKERGIKVIKTKQQIGKLKSQQEKEIFDKEEELSWFALAKKWVSKAVEKMRNESNSATKASEQLSENLLTAAKNKEKISEKADITSSERTSDEVSKSMESKVNQSSEDIVKDKRDLLHIHQKDFCSSADRRNGYCHVENIPSSQNADIRAGNFFDRSYSVNQELGASVYVDYIINNDGLRLNAIPYKVVENNDDAKQLRARSMELMARTSLALLAMVEVKNDRVPIKGLGYFYNQYVLFDMFDDESIIVSLDARVGMEDRTLFDGIKDILTSSSSFQVKSMELMAFRNEMKVKNYLLKEKIMAMAISSNALKLKGANVELQKSISNLE